MRPEYPSSDWESSGAQVQDPSQSLPPWGDTQVVGKALPRVDAYERVSGSAVYPFDVLLPDMLHAAILRCPHAHARVKNVDTRAARAMPGVHAILSAVDPEAKTVVPYPWWIPEGPPMQLFDVHCRYAGEEVAAVAAETPQQAWDAVRAIQVEYEELPFILDAEEALKAGATPIHEGGNLARKPDIFQRGDIERGFAEADAVVERTYQTSFELHTTMEPHGCVACWEGDKLSVWESSQGVFPQQKDIASVLRLPLSSVRVIGHYMGGGFGSKAELSKHTIIAALLARKTARPVKLFLTREETFLCVGNRPANTMTFKAGVRKDGTLTAFHMVSRGAVGAYSDWADVGTPIRFLYSLCPNVRIEQTECYINAGKARAMRAPGFPQSAWALEQMLDELADKIGIDPIELRLKNILIPTPGSRWPVTSSGYRDCLQEGAKGFGWKEARERPCRDGNVLRGVGMAGAFWSVRGGPPGDAILKLFADGSANLNTGAADIGTGTKTVLAMVVAEDLGLPLDQIRIEHADTATTQFAQVSGGSHTVVINAPAVRAAAVDVKRQVLQLASEEFKLPASELDLWEGKIGPRSEPNKAIRIAELKALREREALVGIGRPEPHPQGKFILSFAAHFAEVEVNTRTGEIHVVRLVAAHDSGRVMNLLTYRNQVFGGITMGIGFGLTEQRVLDRQTGKVVNANWHDYKIPTAKDVPADLTCLPIDPHDTECNSVGAKGLGEPATIPTAAAIANAVYHATGIRVTQAPITPMLMLKLLARQQGGK